MRTRNRAPAGTRSSVRGLACEVMRSMAFSLLTSVSSSSRFSRICARDAVGIERRVVHGQARRAGCDAIERLAPHALHARRGCGRTAGRSRRPDGRSGGCALPGRGVWTRDQLGGHGQPPDLLEQRPQLAAQRAAGNVGPSERILDHGIVGCRRSRASLCRRRRAGRFRSAARLRGSAFRSISTGFARCERSCFRLTRCRRRWLRTDP